MLFHTSHRSRPPGQALETQHQGNQGIPPTVHGFLTALAGNFVVVVIFVVAAAWVDRR
jgi:hypothetical protein